MSMQPAYDTRLEFDMADRMSRALRVSGIGVSEMADHLEVSRNAVSNWINGHNRPRERDLRGFALRTGFPIEWLRDGDERPTPPENLQKITDRLLAPNIISMDAYRAPQSTTETAAAA